MEKVTVFGGSGFLGSYVADELTSRNYRVIIADKISPKYKLSNQKFVVCDILKPETLSKAVDGADFVYNFAGLADINESVNLPFETIRQNVLGNINILEACGSQKLKRFVYASSAYAFSTKGSFYGISKLTSEKIVEEYQKLLNLPFTIIRYGSLYGERADYHNGVYKLLRDTLENKEIVCRGDGESVREYIHARDAANLSIDIIEDEQFVNQHMILTGVERLRQKDFVQMISEILNDEVEIRYVDESLEAHYQQTPYSYNPTVARKLVSKTFTDLGQGLVSCIKEIDEELKRDSAKKSNTSDNQTN